MIYTASLYVFFFTTRLFMLYVVVRYLAEHYGCPQPTPGELAVALSVLESMRDSTPPTEEQTKANTDPSRVTVFVIITGAQVALVSGLILFAL